MTSHAELPAGFRQERLRVLAEDELVLVHGLYHGLGPVPIVGCDLWRVADDRIAEHWDARQPWADQTVSGHTMTYGPAIVTEPDETAASKKLVEQFVDRPGELAGLARSTPRWPATWPPRPRRTRPRPGA